LKSKWVLDASNGLVTTEIGFVTMTLLSSQVLIRDDLTLIRGCDDAGNRGFMVFRADRLPFHSLASNARDAVADALAAHRRADKLVAHFGGKEALKSAVSATPWHQMCIFDDTYHAGLCEWGIKSFLARYRLMRRVGPALGMPHGVMRLAGSYGERITAAALMRTQQANSMAPVKP
jgi:hypothetical protein